MNINLFNNQPNSFKDSNKYTKSSFSPLHRFSIKSTSSKLNENMNRSKQNKHNLISSYKENLDNNKKLFNKIAYSSNSSNSNKEFKENEETPRTHKENQSEFTYSEIDFIIQKFLKKTESATSATNSNEQTYASLNNNKTNLMTKILENKKIENITKKAAEYVDQCKRTNDDLYIIISEYNKKKEKLKKFAKNLNKLHKEIKEKDQSLKSKEKHFEEVETNLNKDKNLLIENKKKFENFVDAKSKELQQKANEINENLDNLQNEEKILKFKSDEIEDRLEQTKKIEEEMKKLFNQFQFEKNQFESEKMEFNYRKSEFEIYQKEIIKKYNETKLIHEEMNKKKATQEILQSELNSKEQNVKFLFKKYEEENKIFLQKNEELEKRIHTLSESETRINKLKLETEDKLKELSNELEETKRLNKILRDKEIVYKIKHNIEQDLDLKLSEIELNENLSKKKIAIQEKLLNEEILKKLNNTLISQSKFYK